MCRACPTRLHVFALALVTALVLSSGGCKKRVNKLAQFRGQIHDVYITTSSPARPTVSIGNTQQRDDLLAAAAQIGAGVMTIEMQKRITTAAPGKRIRAKFSGPYREEVLDAFSYTEVAQDDPCDAWIDVQAQSYGISAQTAESALNFFFNARVDMYDCEDGVKIWEMWANHAEPITRQYTHPEDSQGVQAANAFVNVFALNELTDKQLAYMFDLLAENAGYAIATQMVRDSRRQLTDEDREEMQEREQQRAREPEPAPVEPRKKKKAPKKAPAVEVEKATEPATDDAFGLPTEDELSD